MVDWVLFVIVGDDDDDDGKHNTDVSRSETQTRDCVLTQGKVTSVSFGPFTKSFINWWSHRTRDLVSLSAGLTMFDRFLVSRRPLGLFSIS